MTDPERAVDAICKAIDEATKDGRLVFIENLTVNIAEGGGARAGVQPTDLETVADEVRRTGDRRLLLRYLRLRREEMK